MGLYAQHTELGQDNLLMIARLISSHYLQATGLKIQARGAPPPPPPSLHKTESLWERRRKSNILNIS